MLKEAGATRSLPYRRDQLKHRSEMLRNVGPLAFLRGMPRPTMKQFERFSKYAADMAKAVDMRVGLA